MENVQETLKRYKKDIVKSGIYLLFLALFVRFYFIEAFKNYVKGGTTFSSVTESAEFLPAPHITLCFSPHFKPSVLKEYGFDWPMSFFSFIKLDHGVSSKWELYQNLSFDHGTDFKITSIRTKLSGSDEKIHEKFSIHKVATYRHGLCYGVSHNINLSTESGKLFFSIEFSLTLPEIDIPNNVQIFLTSSSGWIGLVIDDWPLGKPALLEIPVKKAVNNNWLAKVSQIDYLFMEGVEDSEKCFYEMMMQKSECEVKCSPILYNFLTTLPICNTSDEVHCNFYKYANRRKIRYTCLKQKTSVYYDSNLLLNSQKSIQKTKIELSLYFDKSTKEVREEILVVHIEDFIGSVGGSLGLFLGFSFFTYLSALIDKVMT